jgi:hypothetical protein
MWKRKWTSISTKQDKCYDEMTCIMLLYTVPCIKLILQKHKCNKPKGSAAAISVAVAFKINKMQSAVINYV